MPQADTKLSLPAGSAGMPKARFCMIIVGPIQKNRANRLHFVCLDPSCQKYCIVLLRNSLEAASRRANARAYVFAKPHPISRQQRSHSCPLFLILLGIAFRVFRLVFCWGCRKIFALIQARPVAVSHHGRSCNTRTYVARGVRLVCSKAEGCASYYSH